MCACVCVCVCVCVRLCVCDCSVRLRECVCVFYIISERAGILKYMWWYRFLNASY